MNRIFCVLHICYRIAAGKQAGIDRQKTSKGGKNSVRMICRRKAQGGSFCMSENTQLLDLIYKNARMGEVTLPAVIGKVTRPDLRAALSGQLMEYRTISGEAKEALHRAGRTPDAPPSARSAAAGAALRLNALTGQSPSKVAELMIRGSTMGTIEMSKRIHQYQFTAEPETLQLANRLLAAEEGNIEQMKGFL